MSFPIVFATDTNYLAPTYVAINSLLRNINSETDIELFILGSKISDINKQRFYDLSPNITFLETSLMYNIRSAHLSEELSYISIATYYRFLIPELLSEYDSCLYLDSDIIIRGDITPLLKLPIEDYTIIGAKNHFSQDYDINFYKARCFDCSIPNLDQYVNAGVLLMNLKKLRENDLYKELIEDAVHNVYPYNDQDVLNKYCYGSIGIIGAKYNFMAQYLKDIHNASIALNENAAIAADNCIIVHYATKNKPWAYRGYLMANLWAEEMNLIESKEIKKDFIQPFIQNTRRRMTLKERIADNIKYILRKYILRDFRYSFQRK